MNQYHLNFLIEARVLKALKAMESLSKYAPGGYKVASAKRKKKKWQKKAPAFRSEPEYLKVRKYY